MKPAALIWFCSRTWPSTDCAVIRVPIEGCCVDALYANSAMAALLAGAGAG